MTRKQIQSTLHALSKEGYHLDKAPVEVKVQTHDEKHNTSDEGEARPRQVATAHHADSSPKRAQDAHNKRKAFWHCWKFWKPWKRSLFVASILGGIFYAWVTYKQWRDLKDNFTVDQRAWITMKKISMTAKPQARQETPIQIEYLNTGKTPAVDVSVQDITVWIENGSIGHVHGGSLGNTVIGPGNPEVIHTGIKLSPEVLTAVMAGVTRLYIAGRISYRDIFGNWHNTTYCDFFPTNDLNSGDFFFCPFGNHMD